MRTQPDQEGNKLQRQRCLVSYILFIIIIGGILLLFIYNKTSIKRNIITIKIYREVGRAKDLSAPLYGALSECCIYLIRIRPVLCDIYCKEYCDKTKKTGCLAGGVQKAIRGVTHFEVGKRNEIPKQNINVNLITSVIQFHCSIKGRHQKQ